ncbi:BA75_01020T0 [Komagataella pastoris]|uniref:BA75_01020T0 n=1 Tax=Komagataella pastoris TaxID=4922 RepID=A0A1B2J692_PICPA|nr:BA75_01020T0 [Komagataella pastoris]
MSTEEIIARHRKEKRDQVALITKMKKQGTKSTKKEIMKQCSLLEEELQARHKKELSEFKAENSADRGSKPADDEKNDAEAFSPERLLSMMSLEQEGTPSKSQGDLGVPKRKRNRQKDRLARREAAIREMQAAAAEEANLQTNFKEMELSNITQLCQVAHLEPYDIRPDGHCLFASIKDQLEQRHGIENISIQDLRSLAAGHIKDDPDTYTPFLFDEDTMKVRDINDYAHELQTTAMWGGDMEILALSKELDCPISVMISGRPTHLVNASGSKQELKLVYYRHAYGLGEHYNSLRDKSERKESCIVEQEEEEIVDDEESSS